MFADAQRMAPITAQQWEIFEGHLIERSYQHLDIVQEPGVEPTEFFIVTSGILRNFIYDKKGKEYTKTFRGHAGAIGPFPEYKEKVPVRYYIQAVTPTTALQLHYPHFEEMMDKFTEWQILGRVMAENNFIQKEYREYMLTQLSTIEKWDRFKVIFGDLTDKIPQYQVASYLGITPEALSRALKKPKSA